MGKENAYMKQLIDWKRVWMLFSKKIWLILVATVAGALIGGIGYKLVETATSEGQFYRVTSDFYITFTEDENGVDYFNAYTWDTILRDDPVVDVVMEKLPADITRDQVKAAVTGEMIGDYRILTVYATSLDPEVADAIAKAYVTGLAEFANKIDLLDSIELWSQEEVSPVIENDYLINMMLFGGVVGFVLILLLMAFFYILDDSIYIESDCTQKFNMPFLGLITRKESEMALQELKDNLSYFCKSDQEYYLVSWDNSVEQRIVDMLTKMQPAIQGSLSVKGEDLEILRKSAGAIIVLPWGRKNGRIADKLVHFLQKQDCKLTGTVLIDADDAFLKTYYFGKTKRK